MKYIALFLSCTALLCGVENSIVPIMEKFELVENLPQSKFTVNQLQEIKEALAKKDERIRLMTYNMLFNLYDHNLAEVNRWKQRIPRLVELIREANPDIINTQELWPDQLADLSAQLEEYAFFANPEGETYAIFYKKDRFELIDSEMAKPLAKVILKDNITNKNIAIFNTHLAFSNMEKRELQAREIVETIASESCPAIFSGDLNTFPSRLENEKFPFYDGDYVLRILGSANLKNAKELSLIGNFGPLATFTNDPEGVDPFQGTGTPGVFLDHIFATPKIQILTHAVQPGTVDGNFPSDHLPLIADFLVQ